jgi:hypothetical protein
MERCIEIAGSKRLIHERMGTEVAVARLAGSRDVDTPMPAMPVMPPMPAMRALEVMESMMERAKPERMEGAKIETK